MTLASCMLVTYVLGLNALHVLSLKNKFLFPYMHNSSLEVMSGDFWGCWNRVNEFCIRDGDESLGIRGQIMISRMMPPTKYPCILINRTVNVFS